MMAAHYSPAEVKYILAKKDYNSFRHSLEEHPHNIMHTAIGGDMSDPRTSSNGDGYIPDDTDHGAAIVDPIFWLHHNNIDRLWAKWQAANPKLARQYSGNKLSGGRDNDARDTDDLLYYGFMRNWKVRETFDTRSYCYVFSNSVAPPRITDPTLTKILAKRSSAPTVPYGPQLPTGSPHNPHTPDPYDRNDKYNIRYHEPFDDTWLKSMNYPDWLIAQIHEEEAQIAQFVDYVNAVDGFVSNAALTHCNETTGQQEYVPLSDEEYQELETLLDLLVEAAIQFIGELGKRIIADVKQVLSDLGLVDYGLGDVWRWVQTQVSGQQQGQQQQGGGYGYQQPAYQAPSYQAPSYQAPSYQAPSYQAPSYQAPSYQAPSYQAPSYQAPSYQAPTYQQPSYQQPSYQQPSYQAPSYQAPSYQQPSYQRPSYQQPSYQQPSYQQPQYGPPPYQATPTATTSYY
ncbi:hypothetical protein HK104_002240, partial [Borealophlyctis nickersoniae]